MLGCSVMEKKKLCIIETWSVIVKVSFLLFVYTLIKGFQHLIFLVLNDVIISELVK